MVSPRLLRKATPAIDTLWRGGGSAVMTPKYKQHEEQQRHVAHEFDEGARNDSSAFEDRRATPTRKPSAVAQTIDTAVTSIVLATPTQSREKMFADGV